MNVLEAHVAHAAHTAAAAVTVAASIFLGVFSDHGFGGDQEASNRGCVLQRATHNLGWVDDALRYQIAVFVALGVIAVSVLGILQDFADDHRAIFARVRKDLAGWGLERLTDDRDANLLILVLSFEGIKRLDRTQQRDAAAWNNAFLATKPVRLLLGAGSVWNTSTLQFSLDAPATTCCSAPFITVAAGAPTVTGAPSSSTYAVGATGAAFSVVATRSDAIGSTGVITASVALATGIRLELPMTITLP